MDRRAVEQLQRARQVDQRCGHWSRMTVRPPPSGAEVRAEGVLARRARAGSMPQAVASGKTRAGRRWASAALSLPRTSLARAMNGTRKPPRAGCQCRPSSDTPPPVTRQCTWGWTAGSRCAASPSPSTINAVTASSTTSGTEHVSERDYRCATRHRFDHDQTKTAPGGL